MKNSVSYSNDIHAYIDGELSARERAEFETLLKQDDELKQQVCDIRKIKQQVLAHYQQVPVPPMKQRSQPKIVQWGMAASIMLSIGIGFLLAYGVGLNKASESSVYAVASQARPDKVILHIDSNASNRTQAILQQAQVMLSESQQQGKKVEVEIVANHDGIDLFEANNPSKEAILALLAHYNNLKLVACQRALERRAKAGHPVALIDKVESDKAAIDVIIEKMQQGWGYKKF